MSTTPGRNDPCPCGSGKKYKRCCGAAAPPLEQTPPGPPRDVVPRVMRYARSDDWHAFYESAFKRYNARLAALTADEAGELFERHPELLEVLDLHFHEWLLADAEDETGANIVDSYLERRGWRETPEGREWLTGLRSHTLSLYEVQGRQAGESIVLRDVLRDTPPVEVIERTGSASLQRWDYMVTRIVPFQGRHYLSGAGLHFPRDSGAAQQETLRADFAERFGMSGREHWDVFLRTAGVAFIDAYLEHYLTSPALPELVTRDGEPFCFATQRFTFPAGAREAVARQLAARPELDEQEPGHFMWLEATGKRAAARRVLGWVRLEAEGGRLETNSRARLEQGRALLEEALGEERVRFLPAVFEDPWRAVADNPELAVPDAEDIPPEIRSELLDEYYLGWLDEPIPALGGKTPTQAARSKKGRQQLVALLKDFENDAARSAAPGERYDFTWLWEELGLERPELPADANDDDSEDATATRRALMQAIETQIATDDPPETRQAYDRLRREGRSHDDAMTLIGVVLAEELFAVLQNGGSYDPERYARGLNNLPELPESEAE